MIIYQSYKHTKHVRKASFKVTVYHSQFKSIPTKRDLVKFKERLSTWIMADVKSLGAHGWQTIEWEETCECDINVFLRGNYGSECYFVRNYHKFLGYQVYTILYTKSASNLTDEINFRCEVVLIVVPV